jgi:hypothetical protein
MRSRYLGSFRNDEYHRLGVCELVVLIILLSLSSVRNMFADNLVVVRDSPVVVVFGDVVVKF